MNPRHSILLTAVAVLVIGWTAAYTGFRIARNSKVTAKKVAAYAESVDLSELSGKQRTRAIDKMIDKINALPFEERRQARAARPWADMFQQMTEEERIAFIEGTLPTGFRQMISAFEELPEEERVSAIQSAVERLRREGGPAGERPPGISREMEEKAIGIGLQTLFTESSAQTKAELAPLLEELQRSMESGRILRRRRP